MPRTVAPPKITLVPMENLSPSYVQPRSKFNDEKITELAESIRAHGVLQPLIVRKASGDKLEIVVGERRFRASKLLGMKSLPCIVMNMLDETALLVALVENIQREDLNPIEEALAYVRLRKAIGLSQEDIALKVGKDRTSIANTMRLLRLPKNIQDMLVNNTLSMGHARALMALDSADMMTMVAKKTMREGLSVRRVEGLIRSIKNGYGSQKTLFEDHIKTQNPLEREIRQKLEHALGTKVELKKENNGFAIVIHFASTAQLNGLLDTLGVEV